MYMNVSSYMYVYNKILMCVCVLETQQSLLYEHVPQAMYTRHTCMMASRAHSEFKL